MTLKERFLVAATKPARGGKSRKEKGGLPDNVEVFVGMKVMVTFNVHTDLDVANGARGEIVDIVLDDREEAFDQKSPIINLKYPPLYILVRLLHTKARPLEGLPEGVLPIFPICKSFTIETSPGVKTTVFRRQTPITSAYALTDYRGQGQTIIPVIVDIGRPPTGELTPFNAYVALSRGRGRDHIRLLRDFDDHLFTNHPNEFLRNEDKRLEKLDNVTEAWWTEIGKRTR